MFVIPKPKFPHFEFEPDPKAVEVENLDASMFEPAPKVLEEPTTLSPNFSDSFETIKHPSAVDKMLLPASPELEKQKLQQRLDAKEKQFLAPGIDKMLLPASPMDALSEKDKELKISEDERMEQVINLQRLTNLKI
jgi:hypothetical protein